MAFLDKIKGKIDKIDTKNEQVKSEPKKKKTPSGYMQLDVDIYQTKNQIIVISPMSGVSMEDLDISIENENDVITIQGKRNVPFLSEDLGEYLRQECKWGSFYRQIILPQEVDISAIEAKIHKGILILKLPLLRIQTRGKRKIEIQKS